MRQALKWKAWFLTRKKASVFAQKFAGATSRSDYRSTEEIGTLVGVPYKLAKNLLEGRATALPKNLKTYYQHTLKIFRLTGRFALPLTPEKGEIEITLPSSIWRCSFGRDIER
ncbi:MAG: hypothetical protein N3B10_08150 [Armatimonadetes bacterium]|nr:hypothetical protein [Armatimonadota bacterium]MCX7968446.1 hypothetical protein [Armatimonadota bacterium]MDW8141885.1 hypothetical protein [Armatimonadota bacterium]